MKGRILSIVSRKYDGSFRFRTEVEVLYASSTLILGLGRPGRVVHRADGDRVRQDWSLEYLPLDRPYNIVSFFEPDGTLRDHFCNALTAARVNGNSLSYIDLDLDVVVRRDGTYSVEDHDQFEHNARSMHYPPDLIALALRSVEELVAMAEARTHLFACTQLEEAQARLLSLHANE